MSCLVELCKLVLLASIFKVAALEITVWLAYSLVVSFSRVSTFAVFHSPCVVATFVFSILLIEIYGQLK